ncbi:MAG: membrane protein insertion efficiency factor YidD [Candidatus Izemoplasmatales bacterium]|nr:membrane protein insertion efficiency factor YidD [Candidatus Izemoplasmatales bacterium]
MKKTLINLIKKYQQATKYKNPTCRYHPSCSNYAIDAYKNYNFFIASILSLWRILRCNPLSNGGYDPIPKKKKVYKEKMRKNQFNPLK